MRQAHRIKADPAGGEPGLGPGARAVAQGLRRATLPPAVFGAIGSGLDAAALTLGLWFGAWRWPGADFGPLRASGLAAVIACAVVTLLWLAGRYRLSRLRRLPSGLVAPLGLAWAFAVAAGIDPRAGVVVAGFLLPARALGAALAAMAVDFGLTERRAVIVGGGERGLAALQALEAAGADIRVCGVFDDRDDHRSPPILRGVPKLGAVADLVAFVRAAEIDMLIVTLPLAAERRIREVLKAVEVLPVDVRLSEFADDPGFERRGAAPGAVGLIGVMARPLRLRQRLFKRALDVVGASLAILLLAPVLLLTALAIRLDSPGPVLFRQRRHGYNHRPVDIWKFRSMHMSDCDPTARRVVTPGDPRVTRIGRFIRRSSLDELPQLFNVLKGDLSLVGPRPHALDAVSSRQQAFETIVEGYAARHKVRPGITGWAQIEGWRGGIDDPEALRRRVEHDLHYIENWSIWLDLRILALTPFRLFNARGAY